MMGNLTRTGVALAVGTTLMAVTHYRDQPNVNIETLNKKADALVESGQKVIGFTAGTTDPKSQKIYSDAKQALAVTQLRGLTEVSIAHTDTKTLLNIETKSSGHYPDVQIPDHSTSLQDKTTNEIDVNRHDNSAKLTERGKQKVIVTPVNVRPEPGFLALMSNLALAASK